MTKLAPLLLFCTYATFSAQQDSAKLISEVQIDVYRKPAKLINSTKSVAVAGPYFLEQNPPDRLLESVNLLPGSKMEERSPGSYRFSVRGSTLRSPFGIRNVKVYLDDFALSDASGNTYLNVIDPELLSQIEIYKGPEGGDFGSATGGTALLKTTDRAQKQLGLAGGSFNAFKGNIDYAENLGRNFFQVYSSYQTTESYREQAALERKFLFLKNRFSYASHNQLQAMLFLSDLHYETPGGLNLQQMTDNPRQARPRTASAPGAVEQQAGIYNKMIFAGLSNLTHITQDLSHFVALQGYYNDFRNPFITNYENRFGNNFTLRTHLNFEKASSQTFYQTRIGFEGASARGIIRNYDNNSGAVGDAQNFDNLFTKSGFVFISQRAEFNQKLFLDISGSLNLINYRWESLFPERQDGTKKVKTDFLPNLGVAYLISDGFSIRAKVSKGNSAPTTEELRSSAQEINAALAPEYGWNKEIGVRKQWANFLYSEISLFDFRLKNAIVRRENSSGDEYFINSGETVQQGLEFTLETKRFNISNPVLNGLKFYLAGNLYDFTFKDYQKDNDDFSGNKLTGVPATSFQNLISFDLFNHIKLNLAHYYTSSISLNDANTVVAKPSLIGNIAMLVPVVMQKVNMDVKLSVQNLYNTSYSLGYDINAFGNRYYNPAATRNYVVSLNFKL